MLTGDEEVDDRVREGKDHCRSVKHGEVELLPEAGHVPRQRHGSDEHALETIDVVRVGIVQVGEGP